MRKLNVMPIPLMRRITSVATVIALMAPLHASSAQEKLGILEIFDQFALANAAASKCIKPDNNTLMHYLANFQMITVYTSMELQKQYPNHTKEQITEAMKRKTELLSQKVHDVIRDKGCSDPRIQDLIKRFHVQAEWQPGN